MKTALVTGANKVFSFEKLTKQGIGKAIVQRLLETNEFQTIYLTSRDIVAGKNAINDILKIFSNTSIKYLQLDINSSSSIKEILCLFSKENIKLDILINNAGFNSQVAKDTISINYQSLKNVTTALQPFLNKKARIINISSMAGKLSTLSPQLQQEFTDPNLTSEKIDSLMEKFVSDVENGRHLEEGWPEAAYAVSKLGVTFLTKVLAKEYMEKWEIAVYCCCPGWCKSDMAGWERPPKSAYEGADTPVWLAYTDDELALGGCYSDRKETCF